MRVIVYTLVSCLFVILSSQGLLAERLRILDSKGLTRAVRSISKPALVKVQVNKSLGDIKLKQLDGVAAELAGRSTSPTSLEFNNVTAGTWKLVPTKKKTKVLSVQIEN